MSPRPREGKPLLAGHSLLIVDLELREAYEAHHPNLTAFAAAAMKVFAERELV